MEQVTFERHKLSTEYAVIGLIVLSYNELAFWILGLRKGNLGNYNIRGNLGNKLVLSGSFIIRRGIRGS